MRVNELPVSVRRAVVQMGPMDQSVFVTEYERRRKNAGIAYAAWFFLGWHYLYLGKVGVQFAFWFTFGGFLVWWLVDAFRIPGMVRRANEDWAMAVLLTMSAARSFRDPD